MFAPLMAHRTKMFSVILMRSANGYQFNYWGQIVAKKGKEWHPPLTLVEANEKGAFRSLSISLNFHFLVIFFKQNDIQYKWAPCISLSHLGML